VAGVRDNFKDAEYRTCRQRLGGGEKLSTLTVTPGNANVELDRTTGPDSELSGSNINPAVHCFLNLIK